MYEKVFQLTSRPFVSTPDVERFFSAKTTHRALTQACSCIERASGTVLVVGPTGSGKTLFLNMLQEQFRSVYQVVNLACARLAERHDLLQSILFELNQPYLDRSEGELRLQLIDYLKPSADCPNGILLLVDEAHLLSSQLLDEIRLLTNFVRDGKPRANLVLAGNHRLEENLVDSSLESFNQRVATRCYLTNLNRSETIEFINAAIMRVGGQPNQIFTEDAMEAVHEVTDGCPRLINQVCDHAMILSAGANLAVIEEDCVREAWADVQNLPNPWAAAKQAPATPTEQNPQTSSIEFGNLDDSVEFGEDTGSIEVGTLDETQDEPVAASEDDGQWHEIQFGQLHDEDSEEFDSMVVQEGQSEIEYDLQQVVDTGVRDQVCAQPADVETVADEYQLAPPEPVEPPELPVHKYESDDSSDPLSIASEIDGDDYVDVRFKDLAQFLANGGNPEEVHAMENRVLDEVSDPHQDPVQDETNQLFVEQNELDESQLPMTLTEQVEVQHELEHLQSDRVGDESSSLDEIEASESLEEVPEVQSAVTAALQEAVDGGELDEVATVGDPSVLEMKVFAGGEDRAVLERRFQSTADVWADPFSEQFETEEIVHDPYTAAVAEQNLASLEISRLQLSILDEELEVVSHQATSTELSQPSDLTAQEDVVSDESVDVDGSESEAADVSESAVLDEEGQEVGQTEELEAVGTAEGDPNQIESHIDESELLVTIQRQQAEIAEQILQLKHELGDAEEGQHLDAACEQEATSDEAEMDTPVSYKTEQSLAEITPGSNDDRDILVITRVDRPTREVELEVESIEPETPVSTGRAIRMEYNQLFKQLRAAE